MPAIGNYYPEIVHFVIALLIVGVVLRLVALTGRLAFAGPAAATLIILGTLASVAAVKSGDDAHGPVDARLRVRGGLARPNALAALGNTDGARVMLQTLKSEFPANAAIQRRIDTLR